MSEGVERRFAVLARDIVARGPDALEEGLPLPEELAISPAEHQQGVLEGRRTELYAIAAVMADGAVRRAREDRGSFPPYGLARSQYSQIRAVVTNPEPFEEGSVTSFRDLGQAYVDTMVLHLDRELNERRLTHPFMVKRLEHLLTLYRVRAGPMTRPRLRDSFSFLYGGLHFGVGVCVQLTEVMSRLLADVPGLTAGDKAGVLSRSSRPALQLATLNFDQVVVAHHRLQAPQPPASGAAPGGQSWMDEGKFVVEESGGRPWRIDLREDALRATDGRPLDDMRLTYATQGCPARISPAGGASAIARLWTWSVELARETGLLGDDGRATGEGGAPAE